MKAIKDDSFVEVKAWKVYLYSFSGVLMLAFIAFICYYIIQHQWITYRKAEKAFAKKDYAKALEYYEKSLDEGVNLWLIGDNFAKACSATNKCAQAVKYYEDLVAKKPDNLYVLMSTATFYINLKRYDRAVILYQRALELKPRDHKILSDLALSYKWNGDYLLSIKTYKTLLSLMKEPDPGIYIEIGDNYLLDENYFEAVKYYGKILEKDPKSYIARKKLYLAYCWTGKENGGLEKLNELYLKNPKDLDLGLQISKVYIQDRRYDEARELLINLLTKNPQNEDLIYELAFLEITLGHMKKADDIWMDLLEKTNYRKDLMPIYANLMTKWQDYYKAENIFKAYLENNSYNLSVYYDLASLYIKMKRFIDAENLLLLLLSKDIRNDRLYELMAIIYFERRDYKNSNYWINKMISDNSSSMAKIMKARNYIKLNQFDKAKEEINKISKSFLLKEDGQIEIGKLYLQMMEIDKAKSHFAEAVKLEKEDPILKFYVDFLINKDIKVIDEIDSVRLSPLELQKIADIIASYDPLKALDFYKRSLAEDINNFNSKLGLILTLTHLLKYDESLKLLFELLNEFPNNSEMLLLIARNYTSKENFDAAMKYYDLLKRLDSTDYLLTREIGQTLYEQKEISRAKKIYSSLLSPDVDQLLIEKLKKENLLSKISRYQDVNISNNSVYKLYEDIYKKYQTAFYPLNEENDKKLNQILLSLQGLYEVQKLLYLENESKRLRFLEKNIKAGGLLKELLETYPDDQSALFDYAQAQCSMGMCDEAKKTYKKLLKINPDNKIAKQALKTNEIKSHAYAYLGHDFFQEVGRGDIDRIINNRTDLACAFPVSCRKWFLLTLHEWADKPTFQKNSMIENKRELEGITYNSCGYSMQYSGVYSPYIRTSFGFSQKYYLKKFKMTNTGYIHFWYNKDDMAELGLGYDRKNDLDNYFSLKQKIQTDNFWLEINSLIQNRFLINAKAEYDKYNDSNGLMIGSLNLAYKLTLHPKILKLSLYQEYRNTSELTQFAYNGLYISNIIHPYWTPSKYYGFNFALEWNHEISKYLYCGNQKHFYNLRILAGKDTEKNPTISFRGTYYVEFADRWTISIYGLIHRSSLWNSDAAAAEIKYQF